jgi:predicted acylesterase/phospholipase RssA
MKQIKCFPYVIIIVLFYLSICETSKESLRKDKCYVLALEGGGDKGAYQSGALKGLVDSLPKNQVQWDVITGVSVGAIDAIGIATFEIGKESEAVDFLVQEWRNIKGKGDIYQNWWGGYLEGLFYKTGLYDTSPLKKKIEEIIRDREIKRKFVCGATNFLTGAYETFDEIDLHKEEYVDAITSSAAYPVVFPLINFRGNIYMDGGVKINLDIASGINKCFDMGYNDQDIVVDVVMLNSSILPEQSSKVHPIGILNRYFQISGYDNAMRDLEYTVMSFPKVNFRYIVAPTKKLPSGSIPLTFSAAQIDQMIQMGLEDAKNVVAKGERITMDSMIQDFQSKRSKIYGKRDRRNLKQEVLTTTEDFDRGNIEILEKIEDETLNFMGY